MLQASSIRGREDHGICALAKRRGGVPIKFVEKSTSYEVACSLELVVAVGMSWNHPGKIETRAKSIHYPLAREHMVKFTRVPRAEVPQAHRAPFSVLVGQGS
jgi:hypothetical protein